MKVFTHLGENAINSMAKTLLLYAHYLYENKISENVLKIKLNMSHDTNTYVFDICKSIKTCNYLIASHLNTYT